MWDLIYGVGYQWDSGSRSDSQEKLDQDVVKVSIERRQVCVIGLLIQPNTSIMKSYLIFKPMSRALAVSRWQRSDKISPTIGVPQY
jgi:hypothetical protein